MEQLLSEHFSFSLPKGVMFALYFAVVVGNSIDRQFPVL